MNTAGPTGAKMRARRPRSKIARRTAAPNKWPSVLAAGAGVNPKAVEARAPLLNARHKDGLGPRHGRG